MTVVASTFLCDSELTHVSLNALIYKVSIVKSIAEIPSPSRYLGMGRLINPKVIGINAATAALYQTLDGYFALE